MLQVIKLLPRPLRANWGNRGPDPLNPENVVCFFIIIFFIDFLLFVLGGVRNREASQRLPRARGSDCEQLSVQTEPYGPGSCILCVSTHFEALSGCIRGQEFAIVMSKKSFNNLTGLIT